MTRNASQISIAPGNWEFVCNIGTAHPPWPDLRDPGNFVFPRQSPVSAAAVALSRCRAVAPSRSAEGALLCYRENTSARH